MDEYLPYIENRRVGSSSMEKKNKSRFSFFGTGLRLLTSDTTAGGFFWALGCHVRLGS